MKPLHEPLSRPSPRLAGRGWPPAGRGVCCDAMNATALLPIFYAHATGL
jgi:hypothetical protein